MKKHYLYFLLLSTFLIISCKKEEIPSIVGTWELSRETGGFTGQTKDFPIGNGIIIKFSSDTYQRYENNQLLSSGTYKLMKENSLITREVGNRLIFDNSTNSPRIFTTVSNSRLELFLDAYDGGGVSYRKSE
ncbi:hypothetical protein [Pedobacter cryophilus]|uniref:Lipocalin-like domain-containing protein n=1 Tax=Pedobacter cryophilus TaxID=2571271 RepID=A0A4U1C4B2_9SPHI|nr:hypothetical protein [Pedobacter cryophilus]TKC00680.1 hypothetical protein FA046_03100 [Pedobacter cryophilus]